MGCDEKLHLKVAFSVILSKQFNPFHIVMLYTMSVLLAMSGEWTMNTSYAYVRDVRCTRGYQKVRRLMQRNQYLLSYAYNFVEGIKQQICYQL